MTPNPSTSTAQYSDANPSAFSPNYSGWVSPDGPDDLTTKPTCNTTRTVNSPAGSYPITCSGGVDDYYAFSYVDGTFTVTQEDAYIEYSGDTIAQVGMNLNLRDCLG